LIFFYSAVPAVENRKENCCRLRHVLKLTGPGARAGIEPPYSNVSHIVFIKNFVAGQNALLC